jgi:hypothetical protein
MIQRFASFTRKLVGTHGLQASISQLSSDIQSLASTLTSMSTRETAPPRCTAFVSGVPL